MKYITLTILAMLLLAGCDSTSNNVTPAQYADATAYCAPRQGLAYFRVTWYTGKISKVTAICNDNTTVTGPSK